MRNIVAFNHVSADGYFASRDNKLDWVVADAELDADVRREMQSRSGREGADQGTLLFGRRTYEMFASFWPKAEADAKGAPDPHHPERRSQDIGAMARWLNAATKIVFSKSLKEATWRNTRILREIDTRELESLKRQPGGDIMLFGSGTVASQLSQHGLIDEYRFVVSPILLGDGRPLLSGVPNSVKLELLESKKYPAGIVMERYARAK